MITIMIDLPPILVRSQNSSAWHAKSGAVHAYRSETHQRILCAHRQLIYLGPIKRKVRVHHTWYLGRNPLEAAAGAKCPRKHKKYRPADEGNAIQALKPAIDGIVDSGLLIDDKAKYLEWGTFTRYSTQKEHGGRSCIVLTLEMLHEIA